MPRRVVSTLHCALYTMIWWSEEKAWDTAGVICTDLKCNFKRADMQIWINVLFAMKKRTSIDRVISITSFMILDWDLMNEMKVSACLQEREKADEVWCLREAIGPGWHLCFALPLYTSTLQNTLRGAIGPGWHLQIAIGQALMHEQYLRGEGRTDRWNTFAYLSFDAFLYFSMICFMSRALSKDCAIYIKREFMQIMAWGRR